MPMRLDEHRPGVQIGLKLLAKGQKSYRADELQPAGPYIFIFVIYLM